MKWPWVSRGRLDDALSQVEWLRSENRRLHEENLRIQTEIIRVRRFAEGMPEDHRPARVPMDPVPVELRKHIEGYANKSVQREMMRVALQRRRAGEDWGKITREVLSEAESGEGQGAEREPWGGEGGAVSAPA